MKATFAELNRGKPVIRRVTLSANIGAQLLAYAKYLEAENGQGIAPEELIDPMLTGFMADQSNVQAGAAARAICAGWRNVIWAGYVASKWPVATASEDH
jgi:hypothetical protein